MGRHWFINCPYCKSNIASGIGYGDSFPDIFIPFYRCRICGELISTESREYLTIPVEERIQMKNNAKNCELIGFSLDRTNNKEYIAFLKNNGFKIFPITKKDKEHFSHLAFEHFDNDNFLYEESKNYLYAYGVLIDEKYKDNKTGKIKKEIFEENKKIYNQETKINKWSSIIGLLVGFLSSIMIGSIDPNSYIFVLGIGLGIGSSFLTSHIMTSYFNKKNKKD